MGHLAWRGQHFAWLSIQSRRLAQALARYGVTLRKTHTVQVLYDGGRVALPRKLALARQILAEFRY